MHRVKRIFLALMVLLIFIPVLSVHAAPADAGLLRGKNYNAKNGMTAASVVGGASYGRQTDGNDTTYVESVASGDYIEYDLRTLNGGQLANIQDIYFVADANVRMKIMDGSRNTVWQISPTTTGSTSWRADANPSTAYVQIYFNAAGQKLYEVDLRLAPPPDTTPPAAPTGLAGTTTETTSSFTWSANSESDLKGYNVYRNGIKLTGSPINVTNFSDTSLTPTTEYLYQVSAVDITGNESTKTQLTLTTKTPPDTTPPATPSAFSGTATDGAASFTWNANVESDLAGYNLYRDGTKVNSSLLTGTSYSLTGLTNGITYSFTLAAVDTAGNISAQTTPVSISPVMGLSVNFVPNGTSIIVQFSNGEAPYTVTWSPGSGTATVEATMYAINGLTFDTEYTVTVTDADGLTVTQTLNTGTTVGFVPPVLPNPSAMFQKMLSSFSPAAQIALKIIGAAVALGVIVVLGMYGWRLSKKWLAAAK